MSDAVNHIRECVEDIAEGWVGDVQEKCRQALEQADKDCPHLSYYGVDLFFGPGKAMRCDECGHMETVDWQTARESCDYCGADDGEPCDCIEERNRYVEAGWYMAQDQETGEPYWRPPSR